MEKRNYVKPEITSNTLIMQNHFLATSSGGSTCDTNVASTILESYLSIRTSNMQSGGHIQNFDYNTLLAKMQECYNDNGVILTVSAQARGDKGDYSGGGVNILNGSCYTVTGTYDVTTNNICWRFTESTGCHGEGVITIPSSCN